MDARCAGAEANRLRAGGRAAAETGARPGSLDACRAVVTFSPVTFLAQLLARPLRSAGLVAAALLLAFVRAFAGPRYQPPHTPQNPVTQVEEKR